MKKVLAIAGLGVLMMFVALPAWSYPVDTILGQTYLENASDATEIAWAESVLGLPAGGLSGYDFYKDISYASLDPSLKYLDGAFWSGHSWDYAIVKVDGPNDYTYLFRDDNGVLPLSLSNGDDFLSTGLPGSLNNGFYFNAGDPPKGVSHVDFFGHQEQVPEPATMLLLGLGIIGLAGMRRKFKK
jgi:hypothetical protein